MPKLDDNTIMDGLISYDAPVGVTSGGMGTGELPPKVEEKNDTEIKLLRNEIRGLVLLIKGYFSLDFPWDFGLLGFF